MDYTELAVEWLEKMHTMRKGGPHRHIDESMQGEVFVMEYVARHGSDVLPGEISSQMNVSSARTAQTLNSLERKGLITRHIDKNDRRRILVNLTSEGKEFAEKHQQFLIKCTAKLLSLLGEQDAKEYVRITGRLAELAPDFKEII